MVDLGLVRQAVPDILLQERLQGGIKIFFFAIELVDVAVPNIGHIPATAEAEGQIRTLRVLIHAQLEQSLPAGRFPLLTARII